MDVTDVLTAARVTFRRADEDSHVSHGWVGLKCPYCGGHKYHLGIEVATGRSNCWKCGPKNAVKVLMDLTGISLREALALWKGRVSLQQDVAGGRLHRPTGIVDLQPAHRAYLRSRGFDPNKITRLWGVQGIGMHATLGWRLYIPIHDPAGREVSWTTRAISKHALRRYISAAADDEAVPHKTLLYGAHLARHSIVVTEGPISAWAVGPGAVATFGLSYTAEQVAAIATFPVRAVLFDRGLDAQRRAERLCRQLAALPGQTEQLELETGNDPAEADPAEIAEIRKKFLETDVVSPV